MTDAVMANIARHLVLALRSAARNRDDTSKKLVAQIHTELCAAARQEVDDEEPEKSSQAIDGTPPPT